MTARILNPLRWIVLADLLTISRQWRAFLGPALLIGLLLVAGMGLMAMVESTSGIAAMVLVLSVFMSAMLCLHWVVGAALTEGSLQQLLLAAQPRGVIVAAKVFSHWLLSGLPCIALVLISGVALGIDSETLLTLLFVLAIGTPLVSVMATVLAMRARTPSQVWEGIVGSDVSGMDDGCARISELDVVRQPCRDRPSNRIEEIGT